MGWNVKTHEGRVCYERDGMRVYRTQDIEAIERQERIEAEQRNKIEHWEYLDDERDNTESDLTTTQTIIILAMALGSMLYLMLSAN